MNTKNLLKLLLIIPALLITGLIAKSQVLTESFDNNTFPPAGWTNVQLNTWGTFYPNDTFVRATMTTQTVPNGVTPHSGSGMALYDGYNYEQFDSTELVTPALDFSSGGTYRVSFWMYRDQRYALYYDSIEVFVNSTAPTAIGGTRIGAVSRQYQQPPVVAAAGWYQYNFTIPAGFTGTQNYISFLAFSDFGTEMVIDDVIVELVSDCTGTPTGGTALVSSSTLCGAGQSTDLSLSGASNTTGITYQWESSPAGANTFTDITGATSDAYTVVVNASSDYRCKVTCSNSGNFSYSSTVSAEITGIPANDEACGAISLVVDGPAECGNTVCASAGVGTDEPDVTCSAPNNTVWYKYTPASTGVVDVVIKRANGATDDMDIWLDIFTATGTCPALDFTLVNTSCEFAANLTTVDSAVFTTSVLTAGTDYYFRLDGVVGDFGAYCIALKSPPAPPASCTNNILPTNGATNVTSPVTLSWNSVPDATSYTVYLGTTDPPVVPDDNLGTITDTVGIITSYSLNANTTYYWYVVPNNSGGSAVGCETNRTSFTTAAGPANDGCDNAQNLIVSNGFCGNPVLGTNMFADSTNGLGGASCSSSALPNDVWYYVTVPSTGNVTIQTSAVNTDVIDLTIEAYSGACGTLSPLSSIGCDDDGNPDDFGPSQYHSKLGLTGLTPGETIYIRVMPYDNRYEGAFAICAFDTTPSVRPAVSPGISTNTCTDAVAVNIDSVYKYTWATLRDANGDVIAQVYPNGSILGNTTASFYLNGLAVRQSGGIYYLDRNITITPATQPVGDVLTSLFFKDAELNALAAAAGGATSADLNSTKTSQTCATSATVTSGGTFFTQSGNGDYETDHYVDVIHDSYSTFYLHKGGTALPVNIISFTAQRSGRANKLSWTTAQEVNTSYYVIEHSTDGRHYSSIGQVAATGSSNGNYTFTDYTPVLGINFYRLRIMETNGSSKLSAVRSVRNEGTADVAVYPNPAKDYMMVNITSDITDKAAITVSDMSGKLVYTSNTLINAGMNYINISMAKMSAGTYVIKIQLKDDYVVKKINKL